MTDALQIHPLGTVRKKDDEVRIEIFEPYRDGLLGLDGFSHVLVLYWFHENDRPDRRRTLQVHPRGDRRNPLTGVFATHSPARPNLIAASVCRILSVRSDAVLVEQIDAHDGSPVIDLKCYIPPDPPRKGVRVPAWV
jgi:tRNA-Thr(GGU) m(6)t(6)A37 methyltransferase TsaA